MKAHKRRNSMKATEAMNRLAGLEKIQTEQMPVKAAYRIVKTRNAMKDALKSYEETRNEIVGQYAVDGVVKTDNPNYQECLQKITELGEEEIDFPISQIQLQDIENVKLPVEAVEAMDFMIQEGE